MLVCNVLLALACLGLRLGSHDATTPVDTSAIVVGLLNSLDELQMQPSTLY
jgi:hypothetical protein